MKIIGFDPGTIKMGYGVIEVQQSAIQLIDFGVLKAKPNLDLSKRLYLIYQQLINILNIQKKIIAKSSLNSGCLKREEDLKTREILEF